jgi:hypothetical protein
LKEKKETSKSIEYANMKTYSLKIFGGGWYSWGYEACFSSSSSISSIFGSGVSGRGRLNLYGGDWLKLEVSDILLLRQ